MKQKPLNTDAYLQRIRTVTYLLRSKWMQIQEQQQQKKNSLLLGLLVSSNLVCTELK